MAIVGGLISVVIIRIGFDREQLFPMFIWAILYLGIFSTFLIAGIKFIKKGRLQEKSKRNTSGKKSMGAVIIAVALFCIFLTDIYISNNSKGELTITSSQQFLLSDKYDHNYVYIKEIDKKLIVTRDEYFILRAIRTKDLFKEKSGSVKVDYVWNNFSPQRGKVTKVTKL